MCTTRRFVLLPILFCVMSLVAIAQDGYNPSRRQYTGSFAGSSENEYQVTSILQLANGRMYGFAEHGSVVGYFYWMYSIDPDSEIVRYEPRVAEYLRDGVDELSSRIPFSLGNRLYWLGEHRTVWFDGETYEVGYSNSPLTDTSPYINVGWNEHLFITKGDSINLWYPRRGVFRVVCKKSMQLYTTRVSILFDSNKDIVLRIDTSGAVYLRSSDSGVSWRSTNTPGGYHYTVTAYDAELKTWYGLSDSTIVKFTGPDSVEIYVHHPALRGCDRLVARGGALYASTREGYGRARHVYVAPRSRDVTFDLSEKQWSAIALKRDGSGMLYLRQGDTLVTRLFDGTMNARHWTVAKNTSVSQVRTSSRALLSAALDSSGRALLRSTDNGANWYSVSAPPPGPIVRLANGSQHVVAIDAEAQVYVGDAEGQRFIRLSVPVPEGSFHAMHMQDDQFLIVGKRSFCVLHASTSTVTSHTELSMDSIVNAAVSPKGRIAFIQANGRIIIDDGTMQSLKIIEAQGLRHSVNSITFDGNDRVWISTEDGGAYRLDETLNVWQPDRIGLKGDKRSKILSVRNTLWYWVEGNVYARLPTDSAWTRCLFAHGEIVGGSGDELFCENHNYSGVTGSSWPIYAWEPRIGCEYMRLESDSLFLFDHDDLYVQTRNGLLRFSDDIEHVVDQIPMNASTHADRSSNGSFITWYAVRDSTLCWYDLTLTTEQVRSTCDTLSHAPTVVAFLRTVTGDALWLLGKDSLDTSTTMLIRGLPLVDTLRVHVDSTKSTMSIYESPNGSFGILQIPLEPTRYPRLLWADGTMTTYSTVSDGTLPLLPIVASPQDQDVTFIDTIQANTIRSQTFDIETGVSTSGVHTFLCGAQVLRVFPLHRSSRLLVVCTSNKADYLTKLFLLDMKTLAMLDSIEISVYENSSMFAVTDHGPWIVGSIGRGIFRWKPTGMITDVPTPSLTNDAWSVRSVDGALMISDPTIPEQSMYHVYTHTGVLVTTTPSAGMLEAELSTGLYIIQRVTPTSRSVRYCLNMK